MVFTGCEQSSSITLSCEPQINMGEQASLSITKESMGFARENKTGDEDFDYKLLAVEEGNTIVERLIDTSHNICLSNSTNVKVGLSQKSTYNYPIHTYLVNGDTSLTYMESASKNPSDKACPLHNTGVYLL